VFPREAFWRRHRLDIFLPIHQEAFFFLCLCSTRLISPAGFVCDGAPLGFLLSRERVVHLGAFCSSDVVLCCYLSSYECPALIKCCSSKSILSIVCKLLQDEADIVLESPVQKTRGFVVEIVLPR
jgi:hypothetical protein